MNENLTNVYCSHSRQYYTKQIYTSDGIQIGTPFTKENPKHRICIHCKSEFFEERSL